MNSTPADHAAAIDADSVVLSHLTLAASWLGNIYAPVPVMDTAKIALVKAMIAYHINAKRSGIHNDLVVEKFESLLPSVFKGGLHSGYDEDDYLRSVAVVCNWYLTENAQDTVAVAYISELMSVMDGLKPLVDDLSGITAAA